LFRTYAVDAGRGVFGKATATSGSIFGGRLEPEPEPVPNETSKP
jgi:hypothetical protein